MQLLDAGLLILAAMLIHPMTRLTGQQELPCCMLAASVIAIICHFYFAQERLFDVKAMLDGAKATKRNIPRVTLLLTILASMAALTHQHALFSKSRFTLFCAGVVVAFIVRSLTVGYFAAGHLAGVDFFAGRITRPAAIVQFFSNGYAIRAAGFFDDRIAAYMTDHLVPHTNLKAKLSRDGQRDPLNGNWVNCRSDCVSRHRREPDCHRNRAIAESATKNPDLVRWKWAVAGRSTPARLVFA